MRIFLDQLRDGPLEYAVCLSPAFLNADIEDTLSLGEGSGKVMLRLLGPEVIAEGEIQATLQGSCARCLQSARILLRATVQLYYWPKRAKASPLDIDPAEPDYVEHDGVSLDPDPDLRDLLLLEIPDVLLCQNECRGICPHCGANRNETPCNCGDAEEPEAETVPAHNPDWQKQLQALKIKDERGGKERKKQ